jgi:4,5-DOPA dioxygenase extradiol
MSGEENELLPALYLGHGAPPLLDDPIWSSQLAQWAMTFRKPKGILIVSAHWESAPLALSSPFGMTPLIYDFGGFHPKYYELEYQTPDAHELSALVKSVLPENMEVAQKASRGLDHGAYVPLMKMFPKADIPVLQMSIPTHDPKKLFDLGSRLAKLRQHDVLVIGSGFLTHGLPYLKEFRIEATPPTWSVEFDVWAKEALARADMDALMNFRELAPGMPYAHPTVEHLSPIFVTLGAATDSNQSADLTVEGYWMGLAKTSFQVA